MLKNILLPIDCSHLERVNAMLDSVKSIVGQSDAKVTFLNVVAEIPAYIASQIPVASHLTAMSESEKVLRSLANASELANSPTIIVREGNASRVILKTANDLKANLIVVGSHQPEATDYLLGSVASRVVRHATCSVMVVR